MRLINVETLAIESFFSNPPPPYAILSHTWEDGEVLFEEFSHPEVKLKPGYQKILSSCAQAKADGHRYIWVDTCCIDKRSSAELSEAINSMFVWYHEAVVCYAFLSDVNSLSTMGDARWFTRGWTLQELIAPVNVRLFDADWNFLGTRDGLSRRISIITRIDEQALLSAQGVHFVRSTSVAKRMSWAATRTTTRVEDMAYCLLGLFNVSMAFLYGERNAAFRRLQEEIIRTSTDQSLFAWHSERYSEGVPIGLLARSPADFKGSGNILISHDDETSFQLSNRDLHIKLPFTLITGSRTLAIAHLRCYREDQPLNCVGLLLSAVKPMDSTAIRKFSQFVGIPLLQADFEAREFVRLSGESKSDPASLTSVSSKAHLLRILRFPQYQAPRSCVFVAQYRSQEPSYKTLHLKSLINADGTLLPNPLHGILLPLSRTEGSCAAIFQTLDQQSQLVVRVRTCVEPPYTAFISSFEEDDRSEAQIAKMMWEDDWTATQQYHGSRTKRYRSWAASLSWKTGIGHDILVLEVSRRSQIWDWRLWCTCTIAMIIPIAEPYQLMLLSVFLVGTIESLFRSSRFSLRLTITSILELFTFLFLIKRTRHDIPLVAYQFRAIIEGEQVPHLLSLICLVSTSLFLRFSWPFLYFFSLLYIEETPRYFNTIP
jgi:hypothetical protein